MNSQQISASADRLAENAWFRLIGRGSMIVVAVLLPIIAKAVWDMKSEQAQFAGEVSGKIGILTIQIQSGMQDRYRSTDAKRDMDLQNEINRNQNRMIERLQSRLDRVEQAMSGRPGGPR